MSLSLTGWVKGMVYGGIFGIGLTVFCFAIYVIWFIITHRNKN